MWRFQGKNIKRDEVKSLGRLSDTTLFAPGSSNYKGFRSVQRKEETLTRRNSYTDTCCPAHFRENISKKLKITKGHQEQSFFFIYFFFFIDRIHNFTMIFMDSKKHII